MAQTIAIKLTDREKEILIQLCSKRHLAKHLTMRIMILLKSFEQITYRVIKSELGCSEPTIAKWKQRWSDNYEKLRLLSLGIDGAGISDTELIKEILKILDDSPRSGSPVTFGIEEQTKIQALACESPSKYGLPFSHWTHVSLAQEAVAQGIVPCISSRHLGRILKKTV